MLAAEEAAAAAAEAQEEEGEPELRGAEDGKATAAEVPELLEGSMGAEGLPAAVVEDAAETHEGDAPARRDADADGSDEEEEQREEDEEVEEEDQEEDEVEDDEEGEEEDADAGDEEEEEQREEEGQEEDEEVEGEDEEVGEQEQEEGEQVEEEQEVDEEVGADEEVEEEDDEEEEQEDEQEEDEEEAAAAAVMASPAEASLAALLMEPDQDQPSAPGDNSGSSEPTHSSPRETEEQEQEPTAVREIRPFDEEGSTQAAAESLEGEMASTGNFVSAPASSTPTPATATRVTEPVEEGTGPTGDVASAPDSASPAQVEPAEATEDLEAVGDVSSTPASTLSSSLPAATESFDHEDPEAIGDLSSTPASEPPSVLEAVESVGEDVEAMRDFIISPHTSTPSSAATSTDALGEDPEAARDTTSTSPSVPAAPTRSPLEEDTKASIPADEDLDAIQDLISTPTTTSLSSMPEATESVEDDKEDINSAPVSTQFPTPASVDPSNEDTADAISTPGSPLSFIPASGDSSEGPEDIKDAFSTPAATLSSAPASGDPSDEGTSDVISTPASTMPSLPASGDSSEGLEDIKDVISVPISTLSFVPASGDSSEGLEDIKDVISVPISTQSPTPASGASSEGLEDAISIPISTQSPTPASGASPEDTTAVISTPGSALSFVPTPGDSSEGPEDVKDAIPAPVSTLSFVPASGDSSEDSEDITDAITAPVSPLPASTDSVEKEPEDTISTPVSDVPSVPAATSFAEEDQEDSSDAVVVNPVSTLPSVPAATSSFGEDQEDSSDAVVNPVSAVPSVPAATSSFGEDQEGSSDAISTPALSSAPIPEGADSFEEDPEDTVSTPSSTITPAEAAIDSSAQDPVDVIDLTIPSPDSTAPTVLPSKSSSNFTDESNSTENQPVESTDSPAVGSSTNSPGDDDSSVPESTDAEGALQQTLMPLPRSTDRAVPDNIATSAPTDGGMLDSDATPQATGAVAPEPEPNEEEEEAIPGADKSPEAPPEPTATSPEASEDSLTPSSTPEVTPSQATEGSGPEETDESDDAKPAAVPEEWGIEVFKRPGSIQSGSNVTLRISALMDPSRRRSLLQTSTGKRLSASYFGDGLSLDCSLIIKGPSGAVERCKDCCRSSDPLTGNILAVMQPTASGVHVVRALLCQTGPDDADQPGPCFTSESSNFTVAAAPTDPSSSAVELVVSGGDPGRAADVAVGDESVVRVSPRDRFGNAQDYKLWRSAAGHDDVRVSVWRVPGGAEEGAAVEARTVEPAVEAVRNSTTGDTDLILRFKLPIEGKVAVSVLLKDSEGRFVPVGRGEGGRLLALAIGPRRGPPIGGKAPDEGSSRDGTTAADNDGDDEPEEGVFAGLLSLPVWVYVAVAAGGVALMSVIVCCAVFIAAKRRAKRKALEEYFFDPEKAEPDPPAYRLGPDGLPAGASAEGSTMTFGSGDGSESHGTVDYMGPPPGKEDTPMPLRSKFGTAVAAAASKASHPDDAAGYVDVQVSEAGGHNSSDISSVEISLSTSSVSLETSDPEVKRRVEEAAAVAHQPPSRRRSPGAMGRGRDGASHGEDDRAESSPPPVPSAPSHEALQRGSNATSTPSDEGGGSRTTADSVGSNGSRRPRQPLVDDDLDSTDFSDDDDDDGDDDGSEEIDYESDDDETDAAADESTATPTSLEHAPNPFMSPSSIASTPFAMTPASGNSFGNPLYREDSHGNGRMWPQGGMVSPGASVNPLYTPEKPDESDEGQEPSISNPFADASFDVVDSAPFAQPNPFAEVSADVIGNPFDEDPGSGSPSDEGPSNPFDEGACKNPFDEGAYKNPFDGGSPDGNAGSNPFADEDDPESGSAGETVQDAKTKAGSTGRGWGFGGLLRRGNHGSDSQEAPTPAVQQQQPQRQQGKKLGVFSRWGGRGQKGAVPAEKPEPVEVVEQASTNPFDDSFGSEDLS